MSQTPHLDDSRLSALIDGEADPGAVEHAKTCAECGARVAAWEEARRLVAAPPPPPPAAQREAAVTAALGAGNEEAPAAVSLIERRARLARAARAVAAVAAVLVIVGVVVAAVHAGSHSGPKAVSTAGGSAASRQPPAAAAAPPSGLQPVVHLGAIQGPGPLVVELQSALGQAPTPGSTAGPSGASTTGPTTGPTAGPNSGSSTSPPDAAVTACVGAATADADVPVGSNPSLEASLVYDGDPAAAFVFDQASQHEAVVVAASGCRLLADVTF